MKKLRLQDIEYSEISTMLNHTPQECMDAYMEYMGLKKRLSKTSDNLPLLIKKKEKIHIFGKSGVGKTHTVHQLAEEMNLNVITSYARKEEDLAKDFGDSPFEDAPNIFVLEGDTYYWRKYGLVKRYIENSLTPFIIITVGKDTPTKNITKLVKQVKIYPPTKAEVQQWLNDIGMDNVPDSYVLQVYAKDWRTVKQNVMYGLSDENYTPQETEKFEAREMVYRIIKGTATLKDFDNCIHPLPFILNWLGHNTPNFYTGYKLEHNMNLVSWVDAHKYDTPESYLRRALLQYLPTNKKGRFQFPPYKRNKEDKKDPIKEEVEIQKYTKKIEKVKKKPKKKEEKKQTIEDEIGDFLLI